MRDVRERQYLYGYLWSGCLRLLDAEHARLIDVQLLGGQMEKVSSSIGTQYRYYIEGADQLAAIVASTGSGTPTVDYVLEDHEGSIAALLNSTGTIAANESFTAYGNRREASTWSGAPSATEEAIMDGITRQGFTGQTALGQMGLNHMNGRVEDAVTGTFLSSDPRINDPYNTQDYNRYAYVYNNPLTNFDPTGFDDAPLPQVPWPGPDIDVHACGAGSTTFTIIEKAKNLPETTKL